MISQGLNLFRPLASNEAVLQEHPELPCFHHAGSAGALVAKVCGGHHTLVGPVPRGMRCAFGLALLFTKTDATI